MGKDKLDEALDMHNYATWRIRFEAMVTDLGLGPALLAAPTTEADIVVSNKVKNLLIKNVKDHHLPAVTRAANAKAAWDALADQQRLAADQLAVAYAKVGGIGIADLISPDGGGQPLKAEEQWPYFSVGTIIMIQNIEQRRIWVS